MNSLLAGRMMNMEQKKSAEIYPFLEAYIGKIEEQITEMENVVERYQKKRMKEEQGYQAMSPLRRMLSGKKPDHHLAVEYIHYVKKPMERIRQLRKKLEIATMVMEQTKVNDMITVPEEIEREFI